MSQKDDDSRKLIEQVIQNLNEAGSRASKALERKQASQRLAEQALQNIRESGSSRLIEGPATPANRAQRLKGSRLRRRMQQAAYQVELRKRQSSSPAK